MNSACPVLEGARGKIPSPTHYVRERDNHYRLEALGEAASQELGHLFPPSFLELRMLNQL